MTSKGIVFCSAKGEIALGRCEQYRENGCSFCDGCNIKDETITIEDERKRYQALSVREKYLELRKLLSTGDHGCRVEWTGDGPDPYEEVRGT